MTRRPCEFVYLQLPRPISTNALFATVGKRRVSSKEYTAWKLECGLEVMRQKPGCVDGAYTLTVRVPAKWRGDVDNAIKPVSDLLQSHEIIKNDRLAQRVTAERWPESFVQVLVVSTTETTA